MTTPTLPNTKSIAEEIDPLTETPVAAPSAPPPIFTTELPVLFVSLDAKVREAYLSDDIEMVCGIAATSGSTLLIVNAGLALDHRERAFQIWRKRELEKLASVTSEIGRFLSTHPELREQYDAGTVDLHVLDRAMHEARDTAMKRRMESIVAAKNALRSAVAKVTPDDSEGRFPRLCIIRADGEIGLFRNRPTALAFGREGNLGFHLIPLDTANREFKPAHFEGD
jgi:hypothetical protein